MSPPDAKDIGPRVRIKCRPADFVVEEISAYEPSGAGEHVMVRFTKTDRNTLDAVRAISQALSCDPRASGFAGMKDKRAVTTQTMSVQAPRGVSSLDLARRAEALSLDGITVLRAAPHGNKLKPGHLAGNRFTIALRGLPPARLDEVAVAFERITNEGVPNAFGAQRFGARGDNAERALAWLRGQERAPRDPRLSRLLWSSLQSKVFNALLAARVEDGTFATALDGDLLKLRTSGGLFLCADVQTDRARAAAGEVSATGPIIGARMRWPEREPEALERRVAREILGANFDLASTRSLGEGSRRPLRLWVEELRWELCPAEHDAGHGTLAAGIRVYFVLPKGAYATTVLAAATTIDETRGANDASDAGEQEETT
ncbi:MAG: tRNA pseudouridine(13) synthase TruD [Polyangiaceae bacterium]